LAHKGAYVRAPSFAQKKLQFFLEQIMMICSRISAGANFSWPDDEFDPEKQFEFCRCGAF